MKSLIVLATLLLASQVFSEEVTCYSDKAIQTGEKALSADAQLTFSIDRDTKELSQIVGHIFVRSAYDDGPISIENSYMGFFSRETLAHNPKYRPNRYKGYTQYKDFDALHTAGQESGMWGELVIDLSKADKFDARYIFQAGDHMGGTVIFTCRKN